VEVVEVVAVPTVVVVALVEELVEVAPLVVDQQ
jgi:hypothetical protein